MSLKNKGRQRGGDKEKVSVSKRVREDERENISQDPHREEMQQLKLCLFFENVAWPCGKGQLQFGALVKQLGSTADGCFSLRGFKMLICEGKVKKIKATIIKSKQKFKVEKISKAWDEMREACVRFFSNRLFASTSPPISPLDTLLL